MRAGSPSTTSTGSATCASGTSRARATSTRRGAGLAGLPQARQGRRRTAPRRQPRRVLGARRRAGHAALLTRNPELTAIFTQSLPQAVGAEFAATELDYAIPQRLSLVCYDDMPLADYLHPPLTTIRVPLEALGSAAFDALLAQIDGAESHDIVVPTNPEVIVRQSTALLPHDHARGALPRDAPHPALRGRDPPALHAQTRSRARHTSIRGRRRSPSASAPRCGRATRSRRPIADTARRSRSGSDMTCTRGRASSAAPPARAAAAPDP